MKQSTLTICNATIHPGERVSLALPLPEIYTCAPMYMPMQVIHGKRPGPCLLLLAALHGDEVNGTEIIHRLLKLSLLKQLHGTLIAVPVMNVYGMVNRSRFLPDGIALDTAFPGNETGTHAARFAHVFTSEILKKVDYCIGLQTAEPNHDNLPIIYGNLSFKNTKDLAEAFQPSIIVNVNNESGPFRQTANNIGAPILFYEAGEAMRLNPYAVKYGLRGIINVMRHLGMIREKSKPSKTTFSPFIAEKQRWLRSPVSGLCHTHKKLGMQIQTGDQIATIVNPFGNSEETPIYAEYKGMVVGINHQPLIREGEAIYQVAILDDLDKATSDIAEAYETVTTA